MDYKEKCEQLTKFIKDLYPFMSDYCKEKTEGMIPELKESEDEKIRRKLISALRDCGFTHFDDDFTVQEALDWLEKQDPKKHEEELENAYKCADEVQYRKGYEDAKREFLKQDEQKPAWSEEDEQQMKSCLDFLDNISCGDDSELNDCRNWLKSLKERIKGE